MIEMIIMVSVAQMAEHWVVAPVVAGSSPVTHPSKVYTNKGLHAFLVLPALTSPAIRPHNKEQAIYGQV
jgi:hypothetical protein